MLARLSGRFPVRLSFLLQIRRCLDLHGDIAVTLATATTTATAYSYDEYGSTTNSSRYGWLGTAQRADQSVSLGRLGSEERTSDASFSELDMDPYTFAAREPGARMGG